VKFPFNVYLPALVGAFITSAVSLPLWRVLSRRFGLVDDPGHRKIHQTATPLAGGQAVITGMVVPLLVGIGAVRAHAAMSDLADSLLAHGLSVRGVELAAIIIGALAMLLLGSLDDKFELSPPIKFGGQLLVATLVAAANVRITLFVHSIVFSYAITILWILTIINAFNFTDNMNGLCAGLGAIGAWYFAAIAAVDGQYLVTILALLTCGALLGFLPHNFPRATAFLGDAGSHLVGYLLAVMAILPHFYTQQRPRVWAVFTPLLILAVPLIDLAWVVFLRVRAGKPFYVGDTNHLSHRLVRSGFSQQRAVLIIWLIATALGAIALISVL
jgi:UDP-GlcNAc:undecaprenyl-phosphate GlcNAc-1-phosphate transferase